MTMLPVPIDDRSPRRYNRPTIEMPNLVLVEGPDEFHFLRFLMRREDVQIHVYGGKNQLRQELEVLSRIEGFADLRKAVIIRDADGNSKSALQSVLTQWSHAFSENVPSVSSDEWFADHQGRDWSIWIMPTADGSGDLDELLWSAVEPSSHCGCI